MTAPTKPFYQSTTLWINFAGIIALVLNVALATHAIIDPDIIAIIVAVLNILNRFRNTGSVSKLTLN